LDTRIRQAQAGDAGVVARFNCELAAETEDLRLDAERVNAGVLALLKDRSKGVYYVAEADGRVVGQLMITYEWSDWRNGMIWWIQSVYVLPEYRGRGVFTRLFRHVQMLAAQAGDVCGLRLYMHRENGTARRSYERLGMRRTEYEVYELPLDGTPIEG
jgi:GNAT superfamily N-acetyltransferase